MGESPSSKSVRNISEMKLLAVTAVSLWLLLAVCQADKTAGHVNNNIQVPAASSGAPISPYYSEYDYNLYEPQTQPLNSLDRQATIEAVLGAPVVITAFAAALFGGLLSPLISEGLSRMSEYQIEWPSFSQRVERKKTKTRTKSGKAREFEDAVSSMSWMEVLDNVHSVISTVNSLSKRSVDTEQKASENLSF